MPSPLSVTPPRTAALSWLSKTVWPPSDTLFPCASFSCTVIVTVAPPSVVTLLADTVIMEEVSSSTPAVNAMASVSVTGLPSMVAEIVIASATALEMVAV